MSTQFHISINDYDPIIIDTHEDESVNIGIQYPPAKFSTVDRQIKTHIKIDGLRWRDGEHFHLGWLDQELRVNDKISIALIESSEATTPLIKEKKYIEPELTCSFCHKKKSEVKTLIDGGFSARICDACVETCQQLIAEKNAT